MTGIGCCTLSDEEVAIIAAVFTVDSVFVLICTLFTSSSPVDRSFVDQTELSFLISRTEVFENFVKVHFGRSITNSSYPQNNTVVLRRRTATMFRVSCPYVITRHNNDDSSRSCLLRSHSVRLHHVN